MSQRLECRLAGSDDLVPLYVAGTLHEQELEQFELHLLECDVCRSKVREGAVLRKALQSVPARRHRPWKWVVPALAAAAVTLFLLPRESDLQRLGRATAPPFTGEPVRAQSPLDLADQGMAAYTAADWARASQLLERAAESDPTPGLDFFLGASRLMNEDAQGALNAFRRTLEPENPYTAEARFYSAKAWLRLQQPDSALAHLAGVPAAAEPIHARATALADSIRALRR